MAGWRVESDRTEQDGRLTPQFPTQLRRICLHDSDGPAGGSSGSWRFRGRPGDFDRDFAKDFAKEFTFRFEQQFQHNWSGGGQRTRNRGRFERGDIRLVILTLLTERPMHGYEIIKEIEARFGGLYAPSPGSIYPTLQMLEDMGLISPQHTDGKKVYTLTDEGRAHLAERQDNVDDLWGRVGGWWKSQEAEQVRLLMHEFRALMSALRPALQHLNPDQVRRLREILERTRHDIEETFRTPHGAGGQPPRGAAGRDGGDSSSDDQRGTGTGGQPWGQPPREM